MIERSFFPIDNLLFQIDLLKWIQQIGLLCAQTNERENCYTFPLLSPHSTVSVFCPTEFIKLTDTFLFSVTATEHLDSLQLCIELLIPRGDDKPFESNGDHLELQRTAAGGTYFRKDLSPTLSFPDSRCNNDLIFCGGNPISAVVGVFAAAKSSRELLKQCSS